MGYSESGVQKGICLLEGSEEIGSKEIVPWKLLRLEWVLMKQGRPESNIRPVKRFSRVFEMGLFEELF